MRRSDIPGRSPARQLPSCCHVLIIDTYRVRDSEFTRDYSTLDKHQLGSRLAS